MKIYFPLAFIAFALTFSSCKKCETCVPYDIRNGVISTTPANTAQSIKLCDKTDITAYESLTTFTGSYGDTLRFICK